MTFSASSANSRNQKVFDIAIESSGPLASLALGCEGKILATVASHEQRQHSELFNEMIAQILQTADVNFDQLKSLVVGVGPGSFTGVRVAVSIAKTLAMAKGLPVLGVDSTLNLASQVSGSATILTVQNAHKNMVYLAAYFKSGDALAVLEPVQALPISALSEFLENLGRDKSESVTVVGDGIHLCREFLERCDSRIFLYQERIQYALASSALEVLANQKNIQTSSWREIMPKYIRESEADEKLRKSDCK